MKDREVYLDNNATTPLHPEVKEILRDTLGVFGNASSYHQFGRSARKLIEDSRGQVAGLLGARPEELIFVGSGSEANNTVLNTMGCTSECCRAYLGDRHAIVTSVVEHPCVLETSKCLQGQGQEVYFVGVDATGKVKLNELEQLLTENKIGLVSIMMANNEIGTIQDITKISRLAHRYGALMHTDAVQAVGKMPVNVRELEVDFLTLSAHKIYGPKGVGVLYVKSGVPFCAMIRGGHQELGRRAGTENTLGIAGLGRAVEMAQQEMAEEREKLLALKNKLREGIFDSLEGVTFNGHPTDCLPGTLNLSFRGAEGEAILLYLDAEGIAVSTGSACSSGSLDPSHVLCAIGLPAEGAHGSIRFSLGRENTKEEIDYVLEKLPPIIKKIRRMSTIN